MTQKPYHYVNNFWDDAEAGKQSGVDRLIYAPQVAPTSASPHQRAIHRRSSRTKIPLRQTVEVTLGERFRRRPPHLHQGKLFVALPAKAARPPEDSAARKDKGLKVAEPRTHMVAMYPSLHLQRLNRAPLHRTPLHSFLRPGTWTTPSQRRHRRRRVGALPGVDERDLRRGNRLRAMDIGLIELASPCRTSWQEPKLRGIMMGQHGSSTGPINDQTVLSHTRFDEKAAASFERNMQRTAATKRRWRGEISNARSGKAR